MVSVHIVEELKNHEEASQNSVANSAPSQCRCKSVMQKKVRNLEKRKIKLMGYQEKLASGENLMKDQMEALEKIELVSDELDFAQDMLMKIQGDASEYGSDDEDDTEIPTSNVSIIQEVLKLQSVLQTLSLGIIDKVSPEDVGVSGEDLAFLEEFGKLVAVVPLHEATCEDTFISQTVHLSKFSAKENVPIVGTTYKKLYKTVEGLTKNARLLSNKKGEPEVEFIDNSMHHVTLSNCNREENSNDLINEVVEKEAVVEKEHSVCCDSNVEPVRPAQDILKGVEGEFTFLQESLIHKEPEVAAPVEEEQAATDEYTVVEGGESVHPIVQVSQGDTTYVPKIIPVPYSGNIYLPQSTVQTYPSYNYVASTVPVYQNSFVPVVINGTTYFQAPQETDDVAVEGVPTSEGYHNVIQLPNVQVPVYYNPAGFTMTTQPNLYHHSPMGQQEQMQQCDETLTQPDVLQLHFQQPLSQAVPLPSPNLITVGHYPRGRGGRGNYRGHRGGYNQSRYNRQQDDGSRGGFRGPSRNYRNHNENGSN